MTAAILGILLSFGAYWLAFPRGTDRRPFLFGALILIQLAAAFAYYVHSVAEIEVDAVRYYFDPHGVAARAPILPGTVIVYKVVQSLRAIGANLLEQFLFFQCFGMIGIALLIRAVNELAVELNRQVPLLFYVALFLPGLHFWTVAPGKDGIVFAAAALAQWAMLAPRRRVPWFGGAVLALIAVRPHVACVCILAALFQLALARKTRRLAAVAIPVGLILIAALTAMVAYTLGLRSMDSATAAEFLDRRLSRLFEFSNSNMETLIYPFRLLSFLFRPLFVDTQGVFGLAVSLENVALLGIFGLIAWRSDRILSLAKVSPGARFALIFATLLVLVLSIASFNLGAAVRQKMMAMPAILLLFAGTMMFDRGAGAAKPATRESP